MRKSSVQSGKLTILNNNLTRLYEYCNEAKGYIIITVDDGGVANAWDVSGMCRHEFMDAVIEMETVLAELKSAILIHGRDPSGQKCSC